MYPAFFTEDCVRREIMNIAYSIVCIILLKGL